ncbi:hypothetical protein GQ55_4G112400 [Panicum hallii var. hallii]|uniref:Bifunctional inhibitor/plant lipid transfer protein/seed storage helical domain-containing protein n=1 Tax=Panicum hallii var. hallii TaxID=1504633 RepID=A0A2T7DXI9_9POAL|nr:hypothetical protein GQ55_4G112400 [Panicum hallii var. hallii]
MPDMPTAPCCEPFVASVDLGGGVPCLCASPPSRSLSSPASTPPTSSRSAPLAGGCAPGAPTSPPPAKNLFNCSSEARNLIHMSSCNPATVRVYEGLAGKHRFSRS